MEEPEVPFARGKENASFLKVEALYSHLRDAGFCLKARLWGKGFLGTRSLLNLILLLLHLLHFSVYDWFVYMFVCAARKCLVPTKVIGGH